MVLEEIECVRELKRKVFGKLSRVFELGKSIEKILFFCGSCRDRLLTLLRTLRLKCFSRKEDGKRATTVDPDEQLSTQKSNTTQADFIDDKYIEYFEEIENRIKNLEDKLSQILNSINVSETIGLYVLRFLYYTFFCFYLNKKFEIKIFNQGKSIYFKKSNSYKVKFSKISNENFAYNRHKNLA